MKTVYVKHQKKLFPLIKLKNFLTKKTFAKNIVKSRYLMRNLSESTVTVTKINGHHISIVSNTLGKMRYYDMEFKDNKEYNGSCLMDGQTYSYKDGLLNGRYIINEFDGEYNNGQFSGKKDINPVNTTTIKRYLDIREKKELFYSVINDVPFNCVSCYQVIENDKIIAERMTLSYSEFMVVPYNGKAERFWIDDFSKKHYIWTCEMKNCRRNGICKNYRTKTSMAYIDDVLEGPYIEYYDRDMTRKRKEGFYKKGKKSGVWKYYSEDGKVINTEYRLNGRDIIDKFKAAKFKDIKKVASDRIKLEDELSKGKEERVILPKMTDKEKRKAMIDALDEVTR